jgi:methylase of polypeptide subunit release factors
LPQGERSGEIQYYKKIAKDLGLPFTVDLIVCNPPWIPTARLSREMSPLDNGVYDPDSQFLKSALNFARIHLSPNGGEMLLLYSDLAY